MGKSLAECLELYAPAEKRAALAKELDAGKRGQIGEIEAVLAELQVERDDILGQIAKVRPGFNVQQPVGLLPQSTERTTPDLTAERDLLYDVADTMQDVQDQADVRGRKSRFEQLRKDSTLSQGDKQRLETIVNTVRQAGTSEDISRLSTEVEPFFAANPKFAPYREMVEGAITERAGVLAARATESSIAPQNVAEGSGATTKSQETEPLPGGVPAVTEVKPLRGNEVSVDDEILSVMASDTRSAPAIPLSEIRRDSQGVIPGNARGFDLAVARGDFSLEEAGKGWERTRNVLREKYGEEVVLYRAEAPESERNANTLTTLYGDKAMASRFASDGRKVEQRVVKVDDIVAGYATDSGYYEFVVKKTPEAPTVKTGDTVTASGKEYKVLEQSGDNLWVKDSKTGEESEIAQSEVTSAKTPEREISVGDTVYFADNANDNKPAAANFRGWDGDNAILVRDGKQFALKRDRVFRGEAEIAEAAQPKTKTAPPATQQAQPALPADGVADTAEAAQTEGPGSAGQAPLGTIRSRPPTPRKDAPTKIRPYSGKERKLKEFDPAEIREVSLREAVEAGTVTKEEAAIIDSIVEHFPQLKDYIEVMVSEQEFAPTADQMRTAGVSAGQAGKVSIAGITRPEWKGKPGSGEVRHIITLFKGHDVVDFIHEFGEFIYERALTQKDKAIVAAAFKQDTTKLKSMYKNEWFATKLEQWWVKQQPQVKGLEGIFRRVLAAIKSIHARYKGLVGQNVPRELGALFDDIVTNGRDIVEKYAYSADEVVARYITGVTPDKATLAMQGLSTNNKTGWSFDPSSMCPKQEAFVNWIVKYLDEGSLDTEWLSHPENMAALYDAALAEGIDVPCSYCYVEGARRKALAYFQQSKGKQTMTRFAQAKVVFREVPYTDKILQLDRGTINAMNARGGLRLFSFSDYIRSAHRGTIDKVLRHAASVGLSVKAITKNPEFIEDFADTGITINVSIDFNDQGFGMPWNQAAEFKNKYPNVKIRTVSRNVEETRRALESPIDDNGTMIDVVTPYHHEGAESIPEGHEEQSVGSKGGNKISVLVDDNPEFAEHLCCREGGKCLLEQKDPKTGAVHASQCSSNCGAGKGKLSIPMFESPKFSQSQQSTAKVDTSSPAFRRWFGDSVVTESGEAGGKPLVVYHGTTKDFTEFNPAKSSRTDRASSRFLGFFLTDYRGEAERYAKWNGAKGNVMELYLSVKNPYRMSYQEFNDLNLHTYNKMVESKFSFSEKDQKSWEKQARVAAQKLKQRLVGEGYDGIFVEKSHNNEVLEYIAFNPTQIKSAISNTGEYSDTNPDIHKSTAQRTAQSTATLSELTPEQRGIVRRLQSAKALNVVDRAEAERVLVEAGLKSTDGAQVEGFHLNGVSYVIPENIQKGKLWPTILHEVGVHSRSLLLSDRRFARLLESIESRKAEQSETGEAIRAAMARVPKDTKAEHKTEEVLAYLVANQPETSIARRFIAIIKNILVKLGIDPKIFSAADLAALAEVAVRREGGGTTSDIMMSIREAAKAFYSKLATVSVNQFTGMKAQSVEPFLLKQGVKKAEIEALGLREWLATMKPTDKVTREQLADFVRANTVEFEDVVLGGDQYLRDKDGNRILDEETGGFVERKDRTHFDQYTEDGADPDSYREMFVTAPAKSKGHYTLFNKDDVKIGEFPSRDLARKEMQRLRDEEGEYMNHITDSSIVSSWEDGHSQYSEIKNPIIRIRFNTVTVDNVQREKYRKSLEEKYNKDGGLEWMDSVSDAEMERLTAFKERDKFLRIEEMQGPSEANQSKMPQHLRDNIYQIGVKRAIAYAKENGFDGITFATKPGRSAGETQADRYSLEKQIKDIDWTKHFNKKTPAEERTYSVNAHAIDGVDIKKSRITASELVELLGKDVFEKIESNSGYYGSDKYGIHGTLENSDLRIGGEGLKRLYDTDLPRMFEAWGKEQMTKVGFDPQSAPTKDRYTGKFFFGEDSPQFDTREEARDWMVARSAMPMLPVTDRTPGSFPMFSRQSATDPTTDQETGQETGQETDQELAPTQEDFTQAASLIRNREDITETGRLLKTAEYLYKDPQAKRVVDIQVNRMYERSQIEDRIVGEFGELFEKAKKKAPKDYQATGEYLVNTDRTGEAFGTKRHMAYRVTKPDGEFVGFSETKIGAYGMAKTAHTAAKGYATKNGMEFSHLIRDFAVTKDKEEWFEVTDRKGKRITDTQNETKAIERMIKEEVDDLGGKMSAKSIEFVKIFREMTNRAFDEQVKDMRAVLKQSKELGLDEPTTTIIDESRRWAVTNGKTVIGEFFTEKEALTMIREISKAQPEFSKLKPKRRADDEIVKRITLSDAIAMMGDLRGGYFPRQRDNGAVILTAVNAKGKKIREHYDMYRPGKLVQVDGKDVYTQTTFDKALNTVSGKIPLVETLEKRKRQLESAGYTVDVARDTSLPEAVFNVGQLAAAVNSIMTQALADAKTKDKKNYGKYEEAAKEINKLLTASIADMFKQRGYLSSRMKRAKNYWEGFETDPHLAGLQYSRGLAAGIAKRDAAQKMLAAITGREKTWGEFKEENPGAAWEDYEAMVEHTRIDPGRQKILYKDVMGFVEEVLRNEEAIDRVLGTVKGLAIIKFLGFRISSAAVNMTNLIQAVPATISAQSGGSLTSALGAVMKATGKYATYMKNPARLSAEDRGLFLDIINRGWTQAQLNRDNANALRSKLGRGWEKITYYAMFLFDHAERINRATTIYAAFQEVKKNAPGIEYEAALQKARQISDDAHGVYNRGTMPAWTRGGGNPGKLIYTFLKFTHNYLQNLSRMVGEGQFKQAAWMILSPAIIGGAGASVVTPLLSSAAALLGGGDDPEEAFYDWLESTWGSYPTQIGRHGMAGAVGVNIKGSIQMNNPIPTRLSEVLGAPGSVFVDTYRGFGHIGKGEWAKGVEALLPTGIGNFSKAFREATEGISTGSYSPVFYGDEPLKAEPIDAFWRFLSFNPSRLSGIREKQWSEKKVLQKYQDRRQEINSKIKRYHFFGQGNWYEILKEIDRYNELAVGAGRPDINPITSRDIKTLIKRNSTPSKLEQNR